MILKYTLCVVVTAVVLAAGLTQAEASQSVQAVGAAVMFYS